MAASSSYLEVIPWEILHMSMVYVTPQLASLEPANEPQNYWVYCVGDKEDYPDSPEWDNLQKLKVIYGLKARKELSLEKILVCVWGPRKASPLQLEKAWVGFLNYRPMPSINVNRALNLLSLGFEEEFIRYIQKLQVEDPARKTIRNCLPKMLQPEHFSESAVRLSISLGLLKPKTKYAVRFRSRNLYQELLLVDSRTEDRQVKELFEESWNESAIAFQDSCLTFHPEFTLLTTRRFKQWWQICLRSPIPLTHRWSLLERSLPFVLTSSRGQGKFVRKLQQISEEPKSATRRFDVGCQRILQQLCA